jgi:hypothetical protein
MESIIEIIRSFITVLWVLQHTRNRIEILNRMTRKRPHVQILNEFFFFAIRTNSITRKILSRLLRNSFSITQTNSYKSASSTYSDGWQSFNTFNFLLLLLAIFHSNRECGYIISSKYALITILMPFSLLSPSTQFSRIQQ